LIGKEKFITNKTCSIKNYFIRVLFINKVLERLRYFVLLRPVLTSPHLIAAKIKPYLHRNETFLTQKSLIFLSIFLLFFGFCCSSFFFKVFLYRLLTFFPRQLSLFAGTILHRLLIPYCTAVKVRDSSSNYLARFFLY